MQPAAADVPHGRRGYDHGCRCPVCREGRSAYRRELRLRTVIPGGQHGTAERFDLGCDCPSCRSADDERRRLRRRFRSTLNHGRAVTSSDAATASLLALVNHPAAVQLARRRARARYDEERGLNLTYDDVVRLMQPEIPSRSSTVSRLHVTYDRDRPTRGRHERYPTNVLRDGG